MKKNFLIVLSFALAILVGGVLSIAPRNASAQATTTATTTLEVKLTKTLLTMPGNNFFVNDDVPLTGARYLSGGSFVVSGYCSGKSNSNKRGLWLFNGDGNMVGTRDLCLDIGEGASGSSQHAWSVVPNTQPTGPFSFVKEMSGNNNRPPSFYTITGGQLSFESQAYQPPFESNGSDSAANVAAIPGYAVAQKNGSKNVLYRLPDWNVVQTTDARFIPITGVGNSIIGTPTPGNGDLVLYAVQNNTLKERDRMNTAHRPVAAAVDTVSNGTKVGFLFLNDGSKGDHVDIYAVGSSSLSLSRSVSLSGDTTNSSTGWQGALAVSGDYVATVDCNLPAIPAPMEGANDNAAARKCGLAVYKGSQRLPVDRLPNASVVTSAGASPVEVSQPVINGIAMAPDGSIVVTTFYGAYMYKTAAATPPTTFPPEVAIGSGAPQFGGIADTMDLAKGYLLLLSAMFGRHNPGDDADNPPPTGSSTEFQILFKQLSDIIRSQ